jgi:hypothetical protein
MILLVLAPLLPLYLTNWQPGHDWGDDFAMYLLHARNLAEGRPYGDTGYLYNASYPSLGPRAYPPGFPLLIAPIYACCGLELGPYKALISVVFLLALVVIGLCLAERLPVPYAVGAVAAIGYSPYFWTFRNQILSDIPFLLLVYATLLVIYRAHRGGTPPRARPGTVILTAALISLAVGTRSAGVVLLATVVLLDVINYRRWGSYSLAVFLLSVLLISVRLLVFGDGASYLDGLPAVSLAGTVAHLASYAHALRTLWDNGHSRLVSEALWAVSLVAALVVYLISWRRAPRVFEVFATLYVALIAVWPYGQRMRFLIPLAPLYAGYVAEAVYRASFAWPRLGLGPAPAVAGVLVLALSYAGAYGAARQTQPSSGVAAAESVAMFAFVRQRTGAGDVLLFRKPRALALFTGRPATVYRPGSNDEELWALMERAGVTHVVVSRVFWEDEQYLRPFLARYATRFESLYANADFTVLRLRPRGESGAPAPELNQGGHRSQRGG